MKFSMELEVTVEADSLEQAEEIITKALDPITVQCDISDGPFEIEEPTEDEEEDRDEAGGV